MPYDISGFSRYEMKLSPFRVIKKRTGLHLSIRQVKSNRAPQIEMINDNGKRKVMTIYTVAALAFHGFPPEGCEIGYHLGGKITPSNIQWVSRSTYTQRKCSKLSIQEKFELIDLWQEGVTQEEIGERFGIHQSQVSYYVKFYLNGGIF